VAKLIGIEGLDSVVATLKGLPDALKKGPVQRASLAQARYLQAKVKANAPVWQGSKHNYGGEPVKPGVLRDNIIVARTRSPGQFGVDVRYQVGEKMIRKRYVNSKANRRKRRVGKGYWVEGPGYYAKFVELGTATTGHGRPGQPAQRFFGRTFDAESEASIKVFSDTLSKEVDKAVAKLAQQNASKG
jgi:HK97 gp10 family phage protein